ncbi:MAG: DUF4158 domain-containing protein, partial [Chloroflexia bacterium]|nr:DUF4158 domain-containing protein [Chloroflexia bacterium]
MAANILSHEERRCLSTVPTEIGDAELVRFFTLESADLALIDPYADPDQQLDQVAHVCLLRWLGWSPASVEYLPREALVALCKQLHVSIPTGKLQPPAARTSRLHAQRAREHLHWRKYTVEEDRLLGEWLKPLAAEHDYGRVLLDALLRQLYHQKIVRPGLSRLERLVESTRTAAREEIQQVVCSQLTAEQKEQLDNLVDVPAGEFWSPWQRLKETPARASGSELLVLLEKIASIRALELERLDLGSIHPNRIKLLAQQARRRKSWTTARLQPEQRYLLLVCFLDQVLPALVDLAVQIHGEVIQRIFQRAEKKRDTEVVQRGERLNRQVLLLDQLLRLILDEEGIPNAELRAAIYHHVSRDRLTQTAHECAEIAQPADYAPFAFAARSYPYLRSFVPQFLSTLDFQAERDENPLLEAITFMRAVDDGTRRFEDPPLKFVSWKWRSYVEGKDSSVNRRMYELCLHDGLAKALQRGELWVMGSQAYTSFRDDWIADEDWPAARQEFLRQFPHLADVEVFLQQEKANLDQQMAVANQVWPDLKEEVWIEDDTVHLARLEARELPPGTAQLQERLTRLFPRIGIAQLLLEVNHWVGVDRFLSNIHSQEHPTEDLVAKKLA